MNLNELNELDPSNIGEWPIAIKLVLILVLCVLLGVAWYFLDITDQYQTLNRAKQTELTLRQDFEAKQAKAANLKAYEDQLAQMRESFGVMLRQLPNRTQVADLLVDVSQTGLAAGLEFDLFQPQGEQHKQFYAELPIKLKVTGTYNELAEFVSGLAALPRIVTVGNVVIRPVGKAGAGKGGRQLTMEAVARTYRYLDEGGH